MSTQPQRLSTAVYAATEPHRLACEAREVLRWPLQQRRDYLQAVHAKRGPAAAEALRAELRAQYAQREQARHALKQGWADAETDIATDTATDAPSHRKENPPC